MNDDPYVVYAEPDSRDVWRADGIATAGGQGWYFFDDTGVHPLGPYPSREAAVEALSAYAECQ